MKSKAFQKIQKARAGLILDQPFFGSLALSLNLKEDPACETGWTDGTSLGFNPRWIDDMPLEKVKGFIAHEVMHDACDHTTRRGGRDKKRWNIAGDLVINALLEESGFVLPDGGLIDPSYKDKSTDQVYAGLPEPEKTPGGEGDGQGGDDHEQGMDPGGCGEVRDAKNPDGSDLSPPQKKEKEDNGKIRKRQAVQQAKQCGNIPLGIVSLIDELVDPKVDRREILRRFVNACAKNDYQWMPPNRRFVYQGLYLPSCRSEELGELVVVLDTSGSIGETDLQEVASELNDILETFQCKLTVIHCDSEVEQVDEFDSMDTPLRIEAKGGGGTDFRPPFETIEKRGLNPVCVIYFTDGCCNSYPEEPQYPVLWAKWGEYEFTPPFGEVIEAQA